ncbi:hypothetical protein [Alteromonas sp. H39]|uniref:hypothetical protein n=1 Tax=Alteromonas sp. H39 TaxID=3389876 RepID=UPI0039E0533E
MVARHPFSFISVLACTTLVACGGGVKDYSDEPVDRPQSVSFTFDDNADDFTAFTVGHDVDNDANAAIDVGLQVMPSPFEYREGLLFHWDNYTADIKGVAHRNLDIMTPGNNYEVTFEVDLITYVSSECDGDEDNPATDVKVKAGLLNQEPERTIVENTYRVSVRDSHAADHLSDETVLVGDIGLATPECELDPTAGVWERKIIRNDEQYFFSYSSDSQGGPWVYLSVDSHYAGETQVYVADMRVIYRQL